jgi:hypothetical protein
MSCRGVLRHGTQSALVWPWLLFANTDFVLLGSIVGSQDLRPPRLLFRKTIRKMSAPGRIKLNGSA